MNFREGTKLRVALTCAAVCTCGHVGRKHKQHSFPNIRRWFNPWFHLLGACSKCSCKKFGRV